MHPNGSVSLGLSTYKNRKLIVVYIVVVGDFTLQLGCDAYPDLEVVKLTNLQLIDTPEPHITNLETSRRDEDQRIFKTDPVLCRYQNCFSNMPGKLQTKVHFEIFQHL